MPLTFPFRWNPPKAWPRPADIWWPTCCPEQGRTAMHRRPEARMNVRTPSQGNTGSGGTPAHQMSEALEGHTWPLAGSLELVGGNPGQTVLSFQMRTRPCQCVCPASSWILFFRDAGGHSSAGRWPPRPWPWTRALIPAWPRSLAMAAVIRSCPGPASGTKAPGPHLVGSTWQPLPLISHQSVATCRQSFWTFLG